MNDITETNAAAYAARHQLILAEQLGFGIHGTVRVVERLGKPERSAVKVHRAHEPYCRERDAYALLWRLKVTEVLGFHVPQLLHAEDDLLAIEMSIVTRPFVLDFAGAYLDKKPMFGREIWEEWEHEKQEQFGAQWPAVRRVLDEFDSMGIHLLDVTPNNISFAE